MLLKINAATGPVRFPRQPCVQMSRPFGLTHHRDAPAILTASWDRSSIGEAEWGTPLVCIWWDKPVLFTISALNLFYPHTTMPKDMFYSNMTLGPLNCMFLPSQTS